MAGISCVLYNIGGECRKRQGGLFAMAHVYVAVAIERGDKAIKTCDCAAINELYEYVPDMFDYVDEESLERYEVKTIKAQQEILSKVYGYFSKYGDFNTDLSNESINDGLLCGLNDDDFIYIVDCHE